MTNIIGPNRPFGEKAAFPLFDGLRAYPRDKAGISQQAHLATGKWAHLQTAV